MTVNHWGEITLDKKEMKALMRAAGNDVARKTRRLISAGSGGGRTYRGGGGARYRGTYRAGAYRASSPGEPPVSVTGTLRNSLKTYVWPDGNGFAVRERAFYSLFLESGARGGGNPGRNRAQARRHRARSVFTTRVLEPRPHLDRVIEQETANLDRRVRTAFEQGLKWRETK